MFKRRSSDNQSTFWISYADLMAGLLFVFILLIGAIVSKSIILREDLHKKESRLEKTRMRLVEREQALAQNRLKLEKLKQELKAYEKSIENKEKRILGQKGVIVKQKAKIEKQEETIRLQKEEVTKLHLLLEDLQNSLKKSRNRNTQLASELNSSRKKLTNAQSSIKDLQNRLARKDNVITLTKNALKLKGDELEKLNQLLLARNSKIDTLSKRVVILQNLLKESNVTLAEKDRKIQEYKGRVIVLSKNLTAKNDELKLKDKKLLSLLSALDKEKSRHEALLKELQKRKAKIKALTGIRLKVIDALKETLGSKIAIDKNSGALRLASNVLFDKGSSRLKEDAKVQLKEIFEKYIAALMSNKAIRPHLDRIVIEGHTDSDGGYLYNLRLSQQRALAVMNYLLTLPIAKKYNLQKYLVASGRAYLDRIIKNGKEDKEASRRIEIKFQLKNRDALYEIERILDEK